MKSRHQLLRVLPVIAVFALAGILASAHCGQAQTVTFGFNAVLGPGLNSCSGGGVAGSFNFDPITGAVSNVNITTTPLDSFGELIEDSTGCHTVGPPVYHYPGGIYTTGIYNRCGFFAFNCLEEGFVFGPAVSGGSSGQGGLEIHFDPKNYTPTGDIPLDSTYSFENIEFGGNAQRHIFGSIVASQPPPRFAGTPGRANCHGQSVSALAKQYGGLNGAAAALGYASVDALQNAVQAFCMG
jgi:hypothetical protein